MPQHNYEFAGADRLTTMGSSWFISRLYYERIDKSHVNWRKPKTSSNRNSVFVNSVHLHDLFLEQILSMNPANLAKNRIGLSGADVLGMAQQLHNQRASR